MKLKLFVLVHSLELAKHIYVQLIDEFENHGGLDKQTAVLEWGMQKQDIEFALASAKKRLEEA